jgi:hypothetical protein
MTENTEFEHVPPPHPIRPEVDKLTAHCVTLPPLTVLSYAEIEAIIGTPYNSQRGRAIIQRTLKKVVNEHEIGFVTVRKIGLQRADTSVVLQHARKTVPAVRRKVLRGRKFMWCANIDEMDPEQKSQFILESSSLRTLLSITAPKWIGRLRIACTDASNVIPSRDVLQLFLKTKNQEQD